MLKKDLESIVEVLKSFEENQRFYWIKAIEKQYSLNHAELGFIVSKLMQ